EQSWALQGGSAALDPSAMIEDCLLHREVVALPNSSALVFPLVECGVLVGLLVAELEAEQGGREAAVGGPGGPGALLPAGGGSGGSAALLLPALCSGGSAGHEASARGGGGGSVAGSRGGGGVDGASAGGLEGLGQAHGRVHRSLTDEELRCLRLAVPLLSKACGMDARSKLQLAQSSLSAAAARGLLREAQRPLSTLNAFSTMLVPRLKDGEPDKDMAKGIVLQGKRLQDLMWQLEDALHRPQAHGEDGADMFSALALGGAGSHAPAAALGPFRAPSSLPRDPNPAVQELLQLPQPRPGALAPPAAAAASRAGEAGGGPSTMAAAEALPPPAADGSMATVGPGFPAAPGAGPGPVLPGQVTFVERGAAAESSPSVSAEGGSGGVYPFTMGYMAGGVAFAAPATGKPSAAAAGGAPRGRAYAGGVHQPPPVSAMATIDVEADCGGADGGGGAHKAGAAAQLTEWRGMPHTAARRADGEWGWEPPPQSPQPQQPQGGGPVLPALVNPTNVVAALAGILMAACKLAAVSGIGFIASSPLSAVLPRKGGGVARPARPAAPAAAAAGAAAAAEGTALQSGPGAEASPEAGPRLIPRPARPLMVGVPAALLQKIVGHMLDIALQCTPRGGQVCVSARRDGSGVAVVLMHTGRMDLRRLHVRTQAMAAAAAASRSQPPLATSQPAHAARAPAAVSLAAGGRRGGGSPWEAAQRRSGGGAAVATVPRLAAVVAGGGGQAGGGAAAGSGVFSVELAQELAQQAGGHLTVSYPCNMVNALSGSLDVGTSVAIWLPGPCALN
ncbi:hypothetical protein TSOC_008939, partial [Tetrabaena socialis]